MKVETKEDAAETFFRDLEKDLKKLKAPKKIIVDLTGDGKVINEKIQHKRAHSRMSVIFQESVRAKQRSQLPLSEDQPQSLMERMQEELQQKSEPEYTSAVTPFLPPNGPLSMFL